MKKNKQIISVMNKKITSIIFNLIFIFLFISSVNASSIEDAREIVDNYYLYSQQKNVVEYSKLFDNTYLIELYGNDYKTLFSEVFTYFDVINYKLDYQYYTESNDSLSLFFNLKSVTKVGDESINIDNDLVAFFSKKDNSLKLKYIVLQKTFVENMNANVLYNAAVVSSLEESSDLKQEADVKGVSLIDFESLIDKSLKHKNSSSWIFWIILIIVGVLFASYYFIRNDSYKKLIKNKKVHIQFKAIKYYGNKIETFIVLKYKKNMPILKNAFNNTYKKTMRFVNRLKSSVKKKIPRIKN